MTPPISACRHGGTAASVAPCRPPAQAHRPPRSSRRRRPRPAPARRWTRASTTTAPSSSAPPVVGALDLGYSTLELPAEDRADLRLTIYTAEPGSPSADGLALLASWAATAPDATGADRS
ncbi:hypothetical protein [Blastococcus litoris]|uniref:MmyB family transcriptional regulator n=1 Tax=Blastococcus litoris TaxID=2171622 RepID=UPI0013DFE290|nr:hypothetical protein [Blastococcus litoris]